MNALDIVRTMLAKSGQRSGKGVGDLLLFGYQKALMDVIAALEEADEAPRLEWKKEPIPNREVWSFEVFPYQSTARESEPGKVHAMVTWVPPNSGTGHRRDILTIEAATVDGAKRAAEAVIHLHRKMAEKGK